jgi:galactokinase
MTKDELLSVTAGKFASWFGAPHTVAAYAPGRIEVIGNHTDYNEGYVLSAAINMGTCFLAAPSPDSTCRLVAGDLMKEVRFDMRDVQRDPCNMWANYVKGVFAKLLPHVHGDKGWNAIFFSSVPLGAGLSSSAALEMGTALGLCGLYGIALPPITIARIGQAAEHEFAGVKCGVMDQISSLFGKAGHLVKSDFRTLQIETVPLGSEFCFLVVGTNAKHALVDGAYNERRQSCEQAAAWFAGTLDHPVTALRDVSMEEWIAHHQEMPPMAAKRSAHVIGENERVLAGAEALQRGDVNHFGFLMFESHHSSIVNFENSCPELDFIVDHARRIPGILGARLSGGGFGGSAVLLVHPRDTETVAHALSVPYLRKFGNACTVHTITPSSGAHRMATS